MKPKQTKSQMKLRTPLNATPDAVMSERASLFGQPAQRRPYLAAGAAGPHADAPPLPLTLKEKRVLEFLEFYVRQNGVSPTYQEICQHFGFASYNSVQRYLKQLDAKGYVRIPWGNQKRAIHLLRPASALQDAAQSPAVPHATTRDTTPSVTALPEREAERLAAEVFALPLLGRVAAGSPIEAYEHDEFIDVPASLVRHADRTYALRVQGQSMIDDGILDGDVILVQRQSRAENGEIVVAVVNEEATVKRFYMHSRTGAVAEPEVEYGGAHGDRTLELRPANSSMDSMWFRPEDVQLRGVVVGLIRKF